MSEKVGERYTLDEPLEESPLGAAWRGTMEGASGFTRPVLVHELSEELAGSDAFVKGLMEAGTALMSRPHPYVQGIVDVARESSKVYLVVDPVDGPTLKEWVEACHEKGAPAPWGQLLAIMTDVLHALHTMHPRGLAHGGIDTTSIRLDRAGVPVLTRVGVAAACAAGGVGSEALRVKTPEDTITPSGDVFAVGQLVYTILAGASDTALLPEDLRARLLAGKPVDLKLVRDDLPAVVLGTVERALQSDPHARFDSAIAMARSCELIVRSLAQSTDSSALGKHIEDVLPGKAPKKPAKPPVPGKPSKRGLESDETDQLDLSDLKSLSIDE